jgi:diguanylate cyclase (GGDEF)-like protein
MVQDRPAGPLGWGAQQPFNGRLRSALRLGLLVAAGGITFALWRAAGGVPISLMALVGLLGLFRALQDPSHPATVDGLTGLPNRRAFFDQIELEAERALRTQRPLAVLLVDINQFRSLNDSFGNATGDLALVAVARKLSAMVRSGDVVARTGSDEFAILMDVSAVQDTGEESLKAKAYQFACRLVEGFNEAIDLGRRRLEIGVSIGVGVMKPDQSQAEVILRRLDVAIEQAKHQPHDAVAVFDLASEHSGLDDYQLFTDLKVALREGQLQMAFQPLVRSDGSWWGLEALARWHHPKAGYIPPDRFTAVAERYRLMRKLGDQIFELSLEGFSRIREELQLPHLRLSTNISPSQLSDPQLHQTLLRRLKEAQLPPELLTLEITEASILERNDASESNLRQLRARGFELALDDFGTGYSSLSLLTRLHPHEVKIDKSFVMALESDLAARQIVAVVCNMAKAMNLHLVAEGVEDEASLRSLQALGVELFQGYHFCRPMAADALIQMAHQQAA